MSQPNIISIFQFILSLVPIILFYPILSFFNALAGPVYRNKYINFIQVCTLSPRDKVGQFIYPLLQEQNWPNIIFNPNIWNLFLSREIKICA